MMFKSVECVQCIVLLFNIVYVERELIYDLQMTRIEVGPVVQQIRRGETPDITHLTQMFLDLYDKVGELCDCPVCLETMDKDKTHIPICGHLICKTCKANPQLDKCPICRKAWQIKINNNKKMFVFLVLKPCEKSKHTCFSFFHFCFHFTYPLPLSYRACAI